MCRSPRTAASHHPSGVVADVSKRASSHTATNQAARHVGSSPAWDELRYNGVGSMRTIGLSQPVNTVDDTVAVHTPRSSTQTSATTRRFAKALALAAGGVAVDEQTDDILGAKKSRNRCRHRPRWSLPGWSGGVRCASRRLSKPRSIWVKGLQSWSDSRSGKRPPAARRHQPTSTRGAKSGSWRRDVADPVGACGGVSRSRKVRVKPASRVVRVTSTAPPGVTT